MKVKGIFKRIFNILCIKLVEKQKYGVKYLFYKGKKTNELIVIFSGFPTTNIRTYNYIKCMKSSGLDRLYILDIWGYRGSYYLYEKGDKYPEEHTSDLINDFLKRGYDKVYMAGSYKGGTCAIYFGLKHGVDEIISGACQYSLGTYLKNYPDIFESMMGVPPNDKYVKELDDILPDALEQHKGGKVNIKLLYSTKEITYETETVDLVKKLRECKYNTDEMVFDFPEHDMIGPVFAEYLEKKFSVTN